MKGCHNCTVHEPFFFFFFQKANQQTSCIFQCWMVNAVKAGSILERLCNIFHENWEDWQVPTRITPAPGPGDLEAATAKDQL